MRVVIINKSDSTGGAAVVSLRLMEALRRAGVDASMLVCEKLSDSPYVHLAAKPWQIKRKFLLERLKIFLANGFNRATLFKIDTGKEGLPLWRHPLVKEADAVLINWVNQGMLSLHGEKKILQTGKPVVWTMHDMWNMTGICHHSGNCERFKKWCGDCPLFFDRKGPWDLSYRVWNEKQRIYKNKGLIGKTAFVAVSNWLKGKALESSLLKEQRIEVIPNAFEAKLSKFSKLGKEGKEGRIRLLFGAARLDDPIKGLDALREAILVLKRDYPELSGKLELAFFGNVKNPESLEGFEIPVEKLGILRGEEVEKAYEASDIVVSSSSYETLPGTLVEAQAYGCIPVSFNQGGQADIIEEGATGFLADYDADLSVRAANLARSIADACLVVENPDELSKFRQRMKENVKDKFSYEKIAREYISLIGSLNEITLK